MPQMTHFNSQAAQIAQNMAPTPIFISTGPDSRASQIELLHRTARRITAARRNFARFHWPPQIPHHARHPMQHQPMHQAPPHQAMPLQTASAYSGILLNFL